MKINGIDIQKSISDIKQQLAYDTTIPDATRNIINLLLLITELLSNRLGLNSRNSNIPPSQDPNRPKPNNSNKNKTGGQPGHKGTTLTLEDNPDIIEELTVDKNLLPKDTYTTVGYERRQIFDLEITRIITEYRAQILQGTDGKRYTAVFPEGINSRVQYGNNLKAHAVYLSQYQLLPYERIREYFSDQLSIPISESSLDNFIDKAYEHYQALNISDIIKSKLNQAQALHVDETSININGKKQWLHSASTEQWTYLALHEKRGKEAMDEINILPQYHGVLCHDHCKPYYQYRDCQHALCNAHHLRELTWAHEQEKQAWAEKMHALLIEINIAVKKVDGRLALSEQESYMRRYQTILAEAEAECPISPSPEGKRGRLKKSKSRNLLERLRDYESDVLRFMRESAVPFSNNQGERDLRVAKLQQKISGCFRSEVGAVRFFALRSYLSSCKKQGVSSSTALSLLFAGVLPSVFGGAE